VDTRLRGYDGEAASNEGSRSDGLFDIMNPGKAAPRWAARREPMARFLVDSRQGETMKPIVLAATLLLTPVWLSGASAQNGTSPGASSQSLAEKSGVNAVLSRQPTAADVLIAIHQFDLFEQAADESAQQRGDNGLREFSASHSSAAEKQDKELLAISEKAGLKIEFSQKPDTGVSGQLAGLQGSVGPDYVRGYYAAQLSQYDGVISSLKRYLEKPDNDDVKAYAAKQLPLFMAGQKSAAGNWDRSKQ
jgi:hypothetical protein